MGKCPSAREERSGPCDTPIVGGTDSALAIKGVNLWTTAFPRSAIIYGDTLFALFKAKKRKGMRSQMPNTSAILHRTRETIFPLVGLACFWAFFRYQNFFMYLYPPDILVAPFDLPAHGVFLIALTALSFAALARWRFVDRLIAQHPALTFASSCLGSIGAALVLFHQGGPAPSGLVWTSAVLVAGGFLTSLLIWARYLSRNFNGRLLLILTTSYLLSLVAFRYSMTAHMDSGAVLAVVALIPTGSGLGWLFSEVRGQEIRGDTESTDLKRLLTAPIWLFIAFLLAGSAVRGMVDIALPPTPNRYRLSVPITALLVLACLLYAFYERHAPRKGAGNGWGERAGKAFGCFSMPQFALACWVVFSAMFLSGVVFLVLDSATLAGNVIVIARSMLELAFWILLCDLASRHDAPSTPLFLVCGAFVEIASWAVSYVAIPLAIPTSTANGHSLDPTLFIFVTVFALTCAITLGFGVLFIARERRRALATSDNQSPSPHRMPDGNAAGGAATEDREESPAMTVPTSPAMPDVQSSSILARLHAHGLTEREASVAVRFAQGFSLGKVAEELCITKSTAQSHIKGAYRKLGIHAKDELIEYLRTMG